MVKKTDRRIFVVQSHKATHLHYDFRIEVDGVLKSWAIPKGPPLKAGEKRLAIPTDDHAIEYAKFEGAIPEGQYGAGIVEVWDQGTYKTATPVSKALKEGKIEMLLRGKKLKGNYMLIRFQRSPKELWLLIKAKVRAGV